MVVNGIFEKIVNGLFKMAGGDPRRFGATLARHKSGDRGLLAKYYTFSVSSETDQRVLNAAFRCALQHRRHGPVDEAKVRKEIEAGFYNR